MSVYHIYYICCFPNFIFVLSSKNRPGLSRCQNQIHTIDDKDKNQEDHQ